MNSNLSFLEFFVFSILLGLFLRINNFLMLTIISKNFMNSISSKSKIVSFLSLVKNCNHKRLGIYYLFSAFIFGISGTLISVLMRIELYSSGNRIISPENQNFYNVSITLHGILMIFFLVMPALFGGFGNYFAPIFQGSPEVVYPRVNNFSILVLFLSYLLLILSLISEFGGGVGWTLYPPLSTSFMSLSPSSEAYLIFGLLMSGISSSLTSLNFWVTILNLRSYCLSLNLWDPINDLCHELYFSSWNSSLGTSYVYCRFRRRYKSLFYRSYNLDIFTDWYKDL